MNPVRSDLEFRVLRALCACPDSARARTAIQSLQRYEWTDPDNAVVFGAICTLAERDSAFTHENLIAIATRAGFPDIELAKYFSSEGVPLESTVRTLLAEP